MSKLDMSKYIGDTVFFKCPTWYYEGIVIEKIGFSLYTVKITIVHYNTSKYFTYKVGNLTNINEDEFNKTITK